MSKEKQPLKEVFGFPPTNFTENAKRYREKKLCPFNNKVPSCTKDKANDPLGVCSIDYDGMPVITCPIRFRENWLIADEAADFFFSKGSTWTSLTEVRLVDADDKSAGNIDLVLVAYDENGKVYDFGSLEIQAVYISGNVRDPFAHYMSNCEEHVDMDWRSESKYPRPDFLSSSRKRLVPQMLFKGGILNSWKKKMAVAVDSGFFNTLPQMKPVKKEEAEIAWLIYDLKYSKKDDLYHLEKVKIVYTKFTESLSAISVPRVGKIEKFIKTLQNKVDDILETPPNNQTIEVPFE